MTEITRGSKIDPWQIGGELIVRELLNVLYNSNRLDSIFCRAVDGAEDTSLWKFLEDLHIHPTGAFRELVPLLPLEWGATRCLFDTEHNVDLLIEGRERCVPVEVKLGLTKARAWFEDNFMGHAGFYREGDDWKMNGKMLSLFQGRFDMDAVGELITAQHLHPYTPLRVTNRKGDSCILTREWLLVLRRDTWKSINKWLKKLGSVRVVVFEEMAGGARDALGGNQEFDKLVLKIIGGGFAESWGI